MIKILYENFKRRAAIKNVEKATHLEEINGEHALDFEAVLGPKLSSYIDENTVYELNDDYFDTAYLLKEATDDGQFIVNVETEHISYRLNNPEYNLEYFTEEGTPEYILGKILEDTDFTVGTVEFSEVVTYSAQEAKSRRQILMEFVAYIGGELKFNKFEISILQHRGTTATKPIIKGKNINVMRKIVNKREKDKDGNNLVSYECIPLYIPGVSYSLGDNVLLIQNDLGLREQLRVVSISHNPYDPKDVTFKFANYVNGLESGLYRIETLTVLKDKVYNGTRIGPTFGFENVRTDKKARSYFNATDMAFQTGDGSGEHWINKMYFYTDPDTGYAELYFGGKLTIEALDSIKAEIDYLISETTIINNLYTEYGRIANLTVSELDTSWKKITNYLLKDTDPEASIAPVYYKKDFEQYSQYFEATTDGESEVQFTNANGDPLYWADEEHKGMTTEDTGLPVMIYEYEETLKMELSFREIDGVVRPRIILGAGYGNSDHPERGKFIIDKDVDGGIIEYTKADGTKYSIQIGEYGLMFNGGEIFESYSHLTIGTRHGTTGDLSAAIGEDNEASGDMTFAQGYKTKATYALSQAFGYETESTGGFSFACGYGSKASGVMSHAEGDSTQAKGEASHAEGRNTAAESSYAHAEGYMTQAKGFSSHAEGESTTAEGYVSHAEGIGTRAYGYASHAEGWGSEAGEYSHAEGYYSKAEGDYSHTEGYQTTASGMASHAEGKNCSAHAPYSHAGGEGCQATGTCQMVFGAYNIPNSNLLFIVGNGDRHFGSSSNALEMDWYGNLSLSGAVKKKTTTIDDDATITYIEAGKFLKCDSSSDIDILVPTDFNFQSATNSELQFMRYGTGNVNIVADTGVTIHTKNTLSITTQYGVATLKHIGTNEWVLYGDV